MVDFCTQNTFTLIPPESKACSPQHCCLCAFSACTLCAPRSGKSHSPQPLFPGSCSDAQGGALLKLQPGRHEEPQHRNGHRAKDDAQHQGLHGCGYADAAPHLQLLGVHGLNGLGHLRHGHHPSRGHRATQPIGVGSCHKGVAQEDGRQQAQGHGGEDTASHGFKLRTSTKQGIGLMGCALSLAADLSLLGWSVWSQDRRIQSKIKHKLGPIRIDPDWASLQEKKRIFGLLPPMMEP